MPWSTRERERKRSMKAPQHSADGAPQQQTRGKLTEDAHRTPHTKSRQNSEMWRGPHSHARDTAATAQQCKRHSRTRRKIAADRISHREPHAVCGGNDTGKLADRPDRKNTISDMLLLSRVSGRDENLHFMRVDTALEQRDRHFSQTREGEVPCERETDPHRQQNALW